MDSSNSRIEAGGQQVYIKGIMRRSGDPARGPSPDHYHHHWSTIITITQQLPQTLSPPTPSPPQPGLKGLATLRMNHCYGLHSRATQPLFITLWMLNFNNPQHFTSTGFIHNPSSQPSKTSLSFYILYSEASQTLPTVYGMNCCNTSQHLTLGPAGNNLNPDDISSGNKNARCIKAD